MRRVMLAIAVLMLAGCGGEDGRAGAEVACQEFVSRQMGSEVEHSSPANSDEATETGEGEWTYNGWARPDTGPQVDYSCVVQRGDDGWTLVDLTEHS